MSFIFYCFTVLAIMWEITCILEPKKVLAFVKITKDKKAKELTKVQQAGTVCMVLYFIWNVVGLMGSQWMLFLMILLLAIIPLKKFGAYGLIVDAIISILILLFILINRFHLHYSMKDIIDCFIK